MLQLPKLKIERSEYREVEISGKLRKWLEAESLNRAEGIHASSLLDIKQAYWTMTDPKPLTEKQVFFFTIGKILHHLVLQAWDPSHDEFRTETEGGEVEGISFHPDLEREDGAPIELKSNRSMREPDPERLQEEISTYLEQLAVYMVLKKKREGELWILYLTMLDDSGRSNPTMRCYTVSLTKSQFELIRQEILQARDLLKDALERRDPSNLPHCRGWKCNKNVCIYWDKCRPSGRWPETRKKHWTS